MKVQQLLSIKHKAFFGDDQIDIKGLAYNSKRVKKDFAFFALPGHNTDGKKFIDESIANGACLIISCSKVENINAAQIVVDDIFKFMSEFCAKFYDHPDKKLKIIAITGTNGKTTTSYMIESILKYAGLECAVFGTINYRYGGKVLEAPNTTPQSLDLFEMMSQIVEAKIKYLVMEVSSHALALGRTDNIKFDIAVFTNLTLDHLDFHKDLESYFLAKAKLFEGLQNGACSIINIDDEYGKRLEKINSKVEVLTYSINSTSPHKTASITAQNIEISQNSSSFDLIFAGRSESIKIKHVGFHNIYNALASFGACIACGLDFHTAVCGLQEAEAAPGRLERVDAKNLGFEIFIDYAHTDDALKNVLQALRALNPKRIVTVFGCGGDRDRSKRPKMGELAANLSDFVFITSDNPRTESASKIILDIEVGIKRINKSNYKVVSDRAKAIKDAVMMAAKGDIILIAGKGHENYQIVGVQKTHFDDKEIAAQMIEERNKSLKKKTKIVQGELNF
ncbi:MAG: UDP-N-acetylmuramoyl-L-alanyl-D-glutamate--2,6-diaminopimelate ligase [Elusimicrobiota bacterium]|jgi:UDP-N-acetylmuramoyl-L-alanyl-D-glutamate--2,6-diaminopimelate ligase|nr:UDP-N-acetylmuramoyl-L-alanyl-D-glutamate--2,6-diaminopimelate ligase [Elusimicrobiota bacterium]